MSKASNLEWLKRYTGKHDLYIDNGCLEYWCTEDLFLELASVALLVAKRSSSKLSIYHSKLFTDLCMRLTPNLRVYAQGVSDHPQLLNDGAIEECIGSALSATISAYNSGTSKTLNSHFAFMEHFRIPHTKTDIWNLVYEYTFLPLFAEAIRQWKPLISGGVGYRGRDNGYDY